MLIDDVCTLISREGTGYDDYGNEITGWSERTVFCRVGSVTRAEYYSAATASMTPELIMLLSEAADYQGEKLVRYPAETGILYSVIRTYKGGGRGLGSAPLGGMELVLARREGADCEPECGTADGQDSE